MVNRGIKAFIYAALLFIPFSARAESFKWTDNYFTTRYEYVSYNEDRLPGRIYTAEIKQKIKTVDAVARYSYHERFGLTDNNFGADIYSGLGRGRWGNISFEASPGSEFLPRWTASAFIYQAIRSFELSLGYKRINSDDDHIDIVIPGFIVYLPHDFYMVEQTIIVPEQGASTVSLKLNYVPNMKWRAFAGAAVGKVGEQIRSEEEFQKLSTRSYSAGLEYRLSKDWGLGTQIYSTNREALYDEKGVSIFIAYWWGG